MHLADITMFFTAQSGGVKRYLLSKRAWLARHTQVRHSLLVPGRMRRPRAHSTRHYATLLPFGHGYRCPLRKTPWTETLIGLRPDVIEAGDPYRMAWAALDAGRRLRVPVVGFYHSDTRGVLRKLLGESAGPAIDRYIRGSGMSSRIHHVHGRLRIKSPLLKRNQAQAEAVRALLERCESTVRRPKARC